MIQPGERPLPARLVDSRAGQAHRDQPAAEHHIAVGIAVRIVVEVDSERGRGVPAQAVDDFAGGEFGDRHDLSR